MSISDYKYKSDLHVHTSPASHCARMSPEAVVELYHTIGVSTVVITNHFLANYFGDLSREQALDAYFDDYERARRRAEQLDMAAVFGAEFAFSDNMENHYLAYGIDKSDMLKAFDLVNLPYSEFYPAFKSDHNLILQAHPHRDNCTLQPFDLIDGIEPFNLNPSHYCRPTISLSAAKGHDTIITGGSDFHREEQLGTCFVLTKQKVTTSDMLVHILKSKDYLLEVMGTVILPYGINQKI